MKYFLGLTFYPDNSFSKKLKALDPDLILNIKQIRIFIYQSSHLFEIEVTETKKLQLELIEELESFYFENTAHHLLPFTGIDVHEYKKNKILYLNPKIDEELSLAQESLVAICQSYISDREKKIKEKNAKKTFLTIGRFQEGADLHLAIELASKEFQEFTSLPFQSICLFSKNNGIWYREADLITFEKPDVSFLQSTAASL